ncbi:MAG TPA: IS110 family transposase [Blastocatellia bacterium]|nr:IS110 family transposase [Blastocatellia bacterium]
MRVVYPICAGIDVHAKMLVACLRHKGQTETRTFSTMTADLLRLRDWLVKSHCACVAIESTGVYWKPVFNILEGSLDVVLVNPLHVKAISGHKTDVRDAQRLADLLAHGLVRPSFIPPPEIRQLRELTRYRESLVRQQASLNNRVIKVLESGNIKLAQVASDALGASGRAMIAALVRGETDTAKLAELACGKLKRKQSELRLALDGRLSPAQRFVLQEQVRRIEQLEAALTRVNEQIDQVFDSYPQLAHCRALLQTIPGIGQRVADIIIAEIGVKVEANFPTAKHLASWCGLCPGNNASGGKRKSGRTRAGNTYLRSALVQAAWAAQRTKQTYLSAQYRRLAKRINRKKAAIAVAHSLIVIVYYVLVRDQSYQDLGGDYFDRQHVEQQRAYLVRRLEALGCRVTVEQKA